MSDSKKDYMMKGQFTAENSVLVLIDYQLGTMQLIRTSNSDVCLRNAVTLATAAKTLNMPVVLTSSQEDRIQGPISPALQKVLPDAYKARVRRQGIVNAWGDPKLMPRSVHGCFVDNENNIWIGGNADGIVQKWTHDGKTMLLQIGRKGVCDNSDDKCGEPGRNGSPTLLNEPADIAVDAANGDVYIADGYGNHRVVVFDANGKFTMAWSGPDINDPWGNAIELHQRA